ncbi:MAG: cytochrome c, partial [Chromatiales bacterium]|nr:cytochrome c [Chromatiales bacterium]
MNRKILLLSTMTAVTLAVAALVLEFVAPAGASEARVHVAEASTGAVAEQIERGGALYKTHCSGCHQAEGQGLPGAFPPLARSDYLLADRKRAIETVIIGLSGPVTVNGQDYNALMPPMGHLADEEIADILTYTLNAWGNDGGPVTSEQVAKVRGSAGVTDRA